MAEQHNTTDNRRKLYDVLQEHVGNMGTWDEFNRRMDDEGNRRKVYEVAQQRVANIGTWDEFNARVYKAPAQAASQTPAQSNEPTSSSQPAQSTPEQKKWQPSTQDKIRMSWELNQSMNAFNRRMDAMRKRTQRIGMQLSPEGRKRLKAGKFQAQLAGTPTKVMGLTSPTQAPASAKGEGNQGQQQPVQSGQSPVPYGVKYVDGKRVTEWLLPDGSLTTSLLEADQAEYSARKVRLRHQFENRMKQNGLDPAKQEDVQQQAWLDHQAPLRKILDGVWAQAEKEDKQADEDYRREMEEYNKSLKSNIRAFGPDGMPLPTPEETLRDYHRHIKRKETFNLERMADQIYSSLPSSYRAETLKMYEQYFTEHSSELKGRSIQKAAEEALKADVYAAVHQRAVDVQMPKSKTEFFMRKLADQPFVSQEWWWDKIAAQRTGSWGMNMAEQQAMSQYGQDHKVLDVVGTIANMAIDPTTYVSGGFGSFMGKQALKAGGKMMLKQGTKEMAERYFTHSLAGRMFAGAVGGAANFGMFESIKNAQGQIAVGGYYNPETGENEGFSFGQVLWSGVHGMGLGAATGLVSPVIGNVADKYVKATSSTAGKVAIRGGELLTSTVAEGTIFSIPEWISGERDAFDVWTDNMGMMLGFKASHMIKSAPGFIASMKSDGSRLSFNERLRQRLDASPNDLAMSPEELNELRRAGYGKLADLFHKDNTTVEVQDAEGNWQNSGTTERGSIKYGPDGKTVEAFSATPEFDGYDNMARLMEDGNVSEAARAKAYYILTGRMLPMSTILSYRTVDTEDGGVEVQSLNANGGVVTSRHFSTIEKARQEIDNLNRQIELNTLDVGERYKTDAVLKEATKAACDEVAARHGGSWDSEGVRKSYEQAVRDLADPKKAETVGQSSRELVEEVEEAIESHIGDYKDMTPDALRKWIGEEYNVDIDVAIRKEPSKRTQEEQAAINRYLEELYPEEARNPQDINQEWEESTDESTEGQKASQEAGDMGYNMSTPEQREQSMRNVRYQESRMAEIFNRNDFDDMLREELGTDDTAEVLDLLPTSRYDATEREAIAEYVKARETADMAIRRMEDDARDSMDRENAFIDKVSHENGYVMPATMRVDNRQVYVVKGNVETTDDSSLIDTSASDRVIYVYDPATDKVEQSSPDQLSELGYVSSVDEAREEAERAITQKLDADIRKVYGKTDTFNPGERYTVDLGEGPENITIIDGVGEDNRIVAEVEGKGQVSIPSEQMSYLIDEYKQSAFEADMRQQAAERRAQAERSIVPVGGVTPGSTPSPAPEYSGTETKPAPVIVKYDQGDSFRIAVSGRDETQHAAVVDREGDNVTIWTPFPVDESSEKSRTMSGYTTEIKRDTLNTLIERDGNGTPVDYTPSNPEPADVAPQAPIETAPADTPAVPKSDENVPTMGEKPENTAESGVIEAETVPTIENKQEAPTSAGDPMPMRQVKEKGETWDEPDYLATTPERSHSYIYNESGLSRQEANDHVSHMAKTAKEAVEKHKKNAPKIGGSISRYQKEKADWENAGTELQRAVEFWDAVKAEQKKVLDAERAIREEKDAQAHDEAVARFEEEQRIKAEKQAEQDRIGTNAVNPKLKARWDNAPKIVGNANAHVLADGSTITGHYVLTEAGAASPSHDPNNAFQPTEGFPIDENGQNVNDRDYSRDKDAQRMVESMAGAFDSRALQTPVIVSQDGVVLSGNNRTMSGDLAASQGTDKAYVDHLTQYGSMYGFTPEQTASMKHPRVVFVPDEALPYDSTTFSRFNAQEMKSQSKPEAAVKLGKIVPDNVFNDIVGDINRYERMSDYYANESAAAHALGALHSAGVINDAQMPELRTGTALSAAGKELLENTLIGKVFQADPDAVRKIMEMPTMRQTIVMALAEIANNKNLAAKGYDLVDELSKAVDLCYRAKTSNPEVYAPGVPVSPFGRMAGLFDDEYGDSRVTDATTLLLADLLNDTKPSRLRNVLTIYNKQGLDAASGVMDLFTGEVASKETILTEINNHFINATPQEQQAIVDAAIAERRATAESATETTTSTEGPGNGSQEPKQTPSSVQRSEGDRGTDVSTEPIPGEPTSHEPSQAPQQELTKSQPLGVDNLPRKDNLANMSYEVVEQTAIDYDMSIEERYDAMIEPLEAEKAILENKRRNPQEGKRLKAINKEIADLERQQEEERLTVGKYFTEELRRRWKNGEHSLSAAEIEKELFMDEADSLAAEKPIQGLEGYSREEIKSIVRADVENALRESDIDVEIVGIEIHGSRNRGDSRPDSDLDVVVEYNGDMKEYAVFNAISEEPITIEGIKVDVNPIRKEETGTLEEYMKKSRAYDDEKLNATKVAQEIAIAEAETNTNPTEAQKEAGNYKMGHVKIDGLDISIENPKGSVRRGTDADGQSWETKMNNTYGYIKGTTGVDGDKIDVFLSDNPTDGNVYVVDQYNTDGTFDEHKVMYGFTSATEAEGAYLSNYSADWADGRKIVTTGVTREEFKKWLDASGRKKKPFADYKSVKAIESQSTPSPESGEGYTLDVYKTKKGKEYHRVKFPRADKEVWKERLDIAKEQFGGTSVPGGYGFKDAETAKSFAESIMHPVSAESLKEHTDALPGSEPTPADNQHVDGTEGQHTEPNSGPEPKETSEKKRGSRWFNEEDQDEAADLIRKMKARLRGGNLYSGIPIDVELLELGCRLGYLIMKKGARKLHEYAQAMIENVGDGIRPYIKQFYNATLATEEALAGEWYKDATPMAEIAKFDMVNFLKEQKPDVVETARGIAAEQEVQGAMPQAATGMVKKSRDKMAIPGYFKPDGSVSAEEKAASAGADLAAALVDELGLDLKNLPEGVQVITTNFGETGGNIKINLPIRTSYEPLRIDIDFGKTEEGAIRLKELTTTVKRGDDLSYIIGEDHQAWLVAPGYKELLNAIRGQIEQYLPKAKPEAKKPAPQPSLFDEPETPAAPATPEPQVKTGDKLLMQYEAMKKKHPDAVLLFRVGDFYETFRDDARIISETLGLTLTSRGVDKTPLAGFPHHALDAYLPKLVRAGKRVAICEQLEEPKLTKQTVKRGTTPQPATEPKTPATSQAEFDELSKKEFEIDPQVDNEIIADRNGFKIGDTVEWSIPGQGKTPATIIDVDRDGRPILDTGMAPIISSIAEWKDLTRKTGEGSQAPAPQRPKKELAGDSAKEQDRRNVEHDFVEAVSNELIKRINNEGSPLTMAEVRNMAEERGMKDVTPTDLQELVERAVSLRARSIAEHTLTGGPGTQEIGFNKIVKLYTTQPVLSDRDVERIQRQQYSTPVPMGYVMDQFMMSHGHNGKRLLEPSAGNGALTIGVPKDNCHVNDIDPRRLANLRAMGFKIITNQDALHPFEGQYDMVVTNPPFGTAPNVRTYDGLFEISTLEGQMAINALDSMTDDGRAAIIVGGSIGKWPTPYEKNGRLQKVADRQFFGYLYSHYNVVDIIPIDGKSLYSRNGTGYNVRMILIDGRRRDAEGNVIREVNAENRVFPPVKEEARPEAVTTYDELYKRVQDDILRIQQRLDVAARNDGGHVECDGTVNPSDIPVANPTGDRGGERPVGTGDSSRTPRSGLGGTAVGSTGTRPGTDERPAGDRKPSGSTHGDTGGTDRRPVDEGAKPEGSRGSAPAGRPADTDGSAQQHNPDGARQRGGSRPERLNQPKPVKVELTDEKVASPHVSSSNQLQSRMPAAQALEFERALHSIEERHGNVDEWLAQELGYADTADLYRALAAEQVEGVAMAIDKMNSGRGFIIADQTGIGKGRQAASIIRYAVRNGHKPIFVTQKAGLFSDMYRDLCDVGSSELRPFIFGSSNDANITMRQEDGTDRIVYRRPSPAETERVYSYIEKHGTLPDEYDYAVTTYSQVQNGTTQYEIGDNGKIEAKPKKYKGKVPAGDITGERRRHVIDLLSLGNYLILDEAHTAGGQSGLGGYMQNIIPGVKGITYLSATYAKRPDNMPLYAIKTAISDSGVEVAELINAVAQGGVPLQEIMSRQLVKSGEMARRERDFSGVTIDWIPTDEGVAREQQHRFDTVSEIFVDIMRFQDTYVRPYLNEMSKDLARMGSSSSQKKGTKDMGIGNAPFASKLYNLLQQLLFSIKVDAVADRAIKNLQNGRKPIISFVNTMEGFLEEASVGMTEDGSASMPTLSLALRKALDGIMRYTVKDDNNNETHSTLAVSQLGPDAERAYNAIIEKMNSVSDDLPIAPLDAIRLKIEAAGYKVGELSGRKLELAKNDKGLYVIRNRKAADKKATASDFNAGKIDVLMVNKTGSTGISLHASSKFEDQRQRVMIAAQFQPDVNDEVQMRGRNDRTGQVVRGAYEYLLSSIPAEQRLQMMFKAKLKSLDANTTSSQKSSFNEMEVVDVLNKYGDAIVWDYLNEDPMGLNMDMGNPLGIDPSADVETQQQEAAKRSRNNDDEDGSHSGFARKALGRLALLSIAEQERVMSEITERYEKKIHELDERGENDLEISYRDLKAKTMGRKVWVEGKDPDSGNAFADNVYMEQVEVNILDKPLSGDELARYHRTFLEDAGVETWDEWLDKKTAEIDAFYENRIATVRERITTNKEATIARRIERFITTAKEARALGKNSFTDEEITAEANRRYGETERQEVKAEIERETEKIRIQQNLIKRRLTQFKPMSPLAIPDDLTDESKMNLEPSTGVMVGIKLDSKYSLNGSSVVFAPLDGRRTITLSLKEANVAFSKIGQASMMMRDVLKGFDISQWDSHISNESRETRYMLTGNILRALVDMQKTQNARGRITAYTTEDGEVRTGILMSPKFTPSDLQSSAPLSSMLSKIMDGEEVKSSNGEVTVRRTRGWSPRGDYELLVPKSKQHGGKYFLPEQDPVLARYVVGGFEMPRSGSQAIGYIRGENLARVLDHLSTKHGASVMLSSKLKEASQEGIEYRTPEEGIEYINARQIQPWFAPLDKLRFKRDELGHTLSLWERQQVRDLGAQEKAWEEKWAAEHTDTKVPTGRRSRFDFYAEQYGQGGMSAEINRAKREIGPLYDNNYSLVSAKARDLARRALPAIARRRADLLADRPSYSRAGQEAIDAELADLEYMALYYQRMEEGEDVERTMQGRFEHQRMLATAKDVAASVGEKVVLYESPGDIEDSDYNRKLRKQRSYGWYNPNDGSIHINVGRHRDAKDIARTVLHEAIGHKSIEQIMGAKRFARLIDEIWNHAGKKVREKIAQKMHKHGWDFREATKEYLGEIAEDVHTKGFDSLDNDKKTIWQRVKAKVQDFLNRILEGLKIPARIRLTENDLSYMMWKLYKHQQRKAAGKPAEGDIFDKAEDIVRREEFNRDEKSMSIAARAEDSEMRYTSPEPEYRPRQKPAPHNTVKVYKLVRIKDGNPNEWYPLFIDSAAPLRMGEWLDADSPDLEMLRGRDPGQYLVNPQTKEVMSREEVYQQYPDLRSSFRGRDTKYPSVEAINYATDNGLRWMEIEETEKAQRRFDGENRRYWNLGINGSGSVSTFSMRPGWHAGSLPTMRQIGKGKDKNLRDDNFVWVEGEVSADINYQEEAERNPDKDLPDRIPEDGYYMKATNANQSASQSDRVGWYVAGSFKANRIISDAEARQIIDDFNAAHPGMPRVEYDYERESGRTFDPESGLHFRDGDNMQNLTIEQQTLKMSLMLADRHSEDVALRDAAVEALGNTLKDIRKAMSVQHTYDYNTVRNLGAVADILISSGTFLPEGPGEVKRLYGIMKRGIGHSYKDKDGIEHVTQSEKDFNNAVESLMDLFVSNQLKLAGKFLDEVMKIRGSKVNARGVEVMGELDVEGQIMVRGMKDYMGMDIQTIHDRIEALDDMIANGTDAVSMNAAAEKMGVELAEQYIAEVSDRASQEKIMRDQLRDMSSQWDPKMNGDARKAYIEQKKAIRESIRKIRIERAEAMRQLASQVGNELRNSIERVKAFREREKQRIEEIWHNANSDMTGRPYDEHGMKKKGLGTKLSNNMVSRLLLAPAATFEQIMRVFGSKSVDGEGYLFDRYVRGWQECRDKEWTSTQEVEDHLNAKASQILGKRNARWSDLYSLSTKQAGSCEWWDGGEIRDHKVTQGNLMYIYMVNKMTDGQVKLRRMCITDEKMSEIEQALNPRLKEVADWLQDDLLPNLRNKYNEVHMRMFGAPMAEIENYFPLKILANARLEEVEMAGKIDGKDLPKTMTGAIIKRRFNNYALDVLNSDAISIALDHIREMETWAAFAEYRRDLCTLLSYKHFRNQVKNMSTIYGSGEKFWDKFYDLSLLVGGAYQPKVSEFDKVAVNITKLATGACIAIRLNTALKQLLSYPAFAPDANLARLTYNMTPWRARACWKWAIANMPSFQRRWKSRQAGNDLLRAWKYDWDWTRTDFVQKVQRAGITPNAFIDALTVAMGSEAIYQSKLKGYLKDGFDRDEAHRRAIQDAEIIFNLSQQSSELPYLSLLQNDRSYLTTAVTNFRNSPMSYLRQSIQSKRELVNMIKSKDVQIEFETKKGVREGLTPEQAKARAERKFKHNWVRNLFKSSTFDYILPALWTFGLTGMWYCIFGKDDDKKKQYVDDSLKRGVFGGLEGFTFGGTIPDFLYGLATGDKPQIDEETSPAMGLISDMANLYSNGKTERAANEMINTMIALGIGVNPQVLEDGVVAGMDFFGEDEKSARDWALLFMRVIQCPQSQMDQVYFDELGMDAREASGKSPAELAERYATYKARRANFATMWAYDEDRWENEVKAPWKKKFEKEAKARLKGQSEDHVNDALEEYNAELCETGKNLRALSNTPGDATTRAAKAQAIFDSPAGTRYKLYNDMHPYLDKMIKSWLNAPTAEAAATEAAAIIEYKAKLVEMLDSWDNPEKSHAAGREAMTIVRNWHSRQNPNK